MKIVHVVAALPRASGLSEAVAHLALAQRRAGHDVGLVTVGRPEAEAALLAAEGGVRICSCLPCWPHSLYASGTLRQSVEALASAADVVHVHGCWTLPVWWGCRAALEAGKPLVRSPHGCLAPERLRLSRWKKALAWRVFERRCFLRSAVIHATCEAEREDVARVLKLGDSKVLKGGGPEERTGGPGIEIVPLGVDEMAFAARRERAALDRRWPACKGKRVALCLSRLHPLKGIDLLLEAWASLGSSEVLKCESSIVQEGGGPNFRPVELPNSRTSPWHLLIAGPDEQGTLASLTAQARRLGLEGGVTFSGPVYGAEKFAWLAGVDLFILPTRNENFGIVVAEALACGVPAITTRGAPWQELLGRPASSEVLKCESSKVGEADGGQSAVAVGSQQSQEAHHVNFRTLEFPYFRTSTNRCGWWIDIGVEPLAEALREALSLTDQERHALGENGRRLAEAKYRWAMIAKAMEKVYEGCV